MIEGMAKKRGKKRDFNEIAHSIVERATEPAKANESELNEDGKDAAAVSLGRRGGLKGGPARAKKLSKKRRSEIAKKAARVRWEKDK